MSVILTKAPLRATAPETAYWNAGQINGVVYAAERLEHAAKNGALELYTSPAEFLRDVAQEMEQAVRS